MKGDVFSAGQRDELRDTCGLIPAQVEALERTIVDRRAFNPSRPPRMQDVRSELTNAVDAIASASDALARLSGEGAMVDPLREAHIRVRDAAIRKGKGDGLQEIKRARDALDEVASSINVALRDLTDQRRDHAGAAGPVRMIHEALLAGWNAHPGPRHGPDGRGPFKPRPGVSENSDFRRVVTICYHAMGLAPPDNPEYEPVRAIRAYMEWLKIERQQHAVERDRITPLGEPSRSDSDTPGTEKI